MPDTPITFTDPCYVLFDVDANAVRTTKEGILAIFNTRAMAEVWARSSKLNLRVIPVMVTPINQH